MTEEEYQRALDLVKKRNAELLASIRQEAKLSADLLQIITEAVGRISKAQEVSDVSIEFTLVEMIVPQLALALDRIEEETRK